MAHKKKQFGSGWVKAGESIGKFVIGTFRSSEQAGQRLAGIKHPMKIKTLARKIVRRGKYK